MEVELGLGTRLPLRQAARGLAAANDPGAAVRGVAERSLAVEGFLGSFFPHTRVPNVVGRVVEPRALALGAVLVQRWWRCFVSYVAHGWRRASQRVGQCRGAPCSADKLGDAVKPVLVEVVDWAVVQELVRHEERGPCVHGNVTSMRRRTGGSQ